MLGWGYFFDYILFSIFDVLLIRNVFLSDIIMINNDLK